jgi:hypothetical protein
MRSTDRTGPRRRWRIAALAALIVVAGLLLALPQLVSQGLARRIFTARAGQILAPGSLVAAAVRVSWFGPTTIDGVVLRDERGTRLVAADRAVVDWNLWQILFPRTETLLLRLPGAALEIERLADGRIDLYETLKPIIREHPDHRLVIEIEGGRLKFHDPALAEPILADRAEIRLDIPRDPHPVEWNVVLGRGAGDGKDPLQATFKGSVHRPGNGGATISLEAFRWPWALKLAGGAARGELDGRLAAERRDARWVLSGDATATNLAVTGEDAIKGADPSRLGPIRAAWEVEGQQRTWTARRLELAVPYARLVGGGTVEVANGTARANLKGSLSPDWEAIQAALRQDVEPNARIAGRPREWRLTGALGERGAEDRLSGLVGELGVQLDALDLYGLRLSETSVVLRTEGGRLRFDPVDARLNEGVLHLEPEVVRPQDGPFRIKVGAASTLKDAVVNDEVSHRVLSYVAPVLDGATRVRGRVSVRGLDAEFPLGEAPGTSARVEGNVLFDEVRFLPGPLAEAIIELLPSPKDAEADAEPMLVLRDPISFRIADRKVYQHGLLVPLGRIGSAALEGSVDFEKHLDLVARFRVNPPRADRPVLAALLNNARFELPIRGTLDEPRIDEEALKARLKSLGSDMLGNSIVAGADGLMRLLEGLPRRREARKPPADDPGAGPPPEPPSPRRPSAEERRQVREQRRLERLEKKAQRRMRRDGTPE